MKHFVIRGTSKKHSALAMDEYLSSVYYDPKHPASYAGPSKLYRVAKAAGKKITLRQIKDWLRGQETYTLHRRMLHKFPRNKVIVGGFMQQWDADLMDMTSLSKYNGGVTFLLVAIDIFSRFLFVVPLKSKRGKDVTEAFASIFAKGWKPYKIRTDRGKEFTNRVLQQLLKEQGVEHFVTSNEVKANYAERVIKTIKGRIFKYFTKKQTYEYVSHLQDFVDSYNHTYHRSIKMKPADVNHDNEAALWQQQYGSTTAGHPVRNFKFDVGAHVRVSYLKTTFMREYNEKWSGEIFTVRNQYFREGIPIYQLDDYSGDDIQGTFYEEELQLVLMPEVFRIEKILRRRKTRGQKQILIRWAGWPAKYDSWIDAEMLETYK